MEMNATKAELGVWTAYLTTRSAEALNAVVTFYAPTVRHTAFKFRLVDHITHDELIAAGQIALWKLVPEFEPERGLRFWTFALPRVRGAMLDEIRNCDTYSRHTRMSITAAEKVRRSFSQALGRRVTDDELVEDFGVSPAALKVEPVFTSLNSMLRGDRECDSRPVYVSALVAATTVAFASDEDELAAWDEAINAVARGFGSRMRDVLRMYARDGMSMAEIGKTMGLSASRVSQMFTNLVAELAERYGRDTTRERYKYRPVSHPRERKESVTA